MADSTVTYYRNELTIVRSVALSTPVVTAGNQVTIVDDLPTATAAPVRQRTEIETTVSYAATFRKRRLRPTINTPQLPDTTVVLYYYRRPDGTSLFKRPDTISNYLRP